MKRLALTTVLLAFLPFEAGAYEFDPEVWQLAVIAEFMPSPVGVEAATGQWIEIQNEGAEPVNLQGMVLMTLSGGFHVVSPAKAMLLGPGGALVLARAGDMGVNGGVDADYVYGGELLLDQEEDVLFLLKGNTLVDIVAYGPDSLDVKAGATFSLEPPPIGVQVVKQWCYGRALFGALGNLGTPGQPNTFCDGDADGLAEDQGDCDDGNPAVHPGALEACNGLDDDCNGDVDDGLAAPFGCQHEGLCAGVVPVCAGAEGFLCPYPEGWEETETTCDGVDNDCDGLTDEYLPLGDDCLQTGICQGSQLECQGTAGLGCTYPPEFEAEEVTCDGLDNDCDEETDEGFGVGESCVTGLGACTGHGKRICDTSGTGAVCDAAKGTPSDELCGDGVDNDCDGETDEGFSVSTNCTVGLGACSAVGKLRCTQDGTGVVCQAVPGDPESEVCDDGIDNDCDDVTDEGECQDSGVGGGGCALWKTHAGVRPVGVLVLLMWMVLAGAVVRRAYRP